MSFFDRNLEILEIWKFQRIMGTPLKSLVYLYWTYDFTFRPVKNS